MGSGLGKLSTSTRVGSSEEKMLTRTSAILLF